MLNKSAAIKIVTDILNGAAPIRVIGEGSEPALSVSFTSIYTYSSP